MNPQRTEENTDYVQHKPLRSRPLLTPPQGNHRTLSLVMVFIMIAAVLYRIIRLFVSIGNGSISFDNIPYTLLNMLSLLAELLVYAKFILHIWEPHRKTLPWLLGGVLVFRLLRDIYSLWHTLSAYNDPSLGGQTSIAAISLISMIISIVTNPCFILLIGHWRNRSTEKIAALISSIGFVLFIGSFVFNVLYSQQILDQTDALTSLLRTYLPTIVSATCTIIFYATWPVLNRPVLEPAFEIETEGAETDASQE